MTEGKLIDKVNTVCEDLLYHITKVESLTEEGKLRLKTKLHEVVIEVMYKKVNYEED